MNFMVNSGAYSCIDLAPTINVHYVENFIVHEPKFTSHSPVTIQYLLKTKKAYNGITIKHGLTNYKGLKTDLTLVNYDEGVFYLKKTLMTCTNNDNDSKQNPSPRSILCQDG